MFILTLSEIMPKHMKRHLGCMKVENCETPNDVDIDIDVDFLIDVDIDNDVH